MNTVQKECLYILKEFDRVCRKYDIPYILTCGTLLGAIRHKGFIPWDDDLDVAMTRENYVRFLQIAKQELAKDFFLQTHETEKNYYNSFAKIRSNRIELIERPTQYTKMNHGVWIDIFPLDKIPNSKELRGKQLKKLKRIDKMINFFAYTYVRDDDNRIKKIIKTCVQRVNSRMIRYNVFLQNLIKKREKLIMQYNCSASEVYNLLSYPLDENSYQNHIHYKHEVEKIKHVLFEDMICPIPEAYDDLLTRLYGNYMTKPPVEDRVGSHGIGLRVVDNDE